ncbi:MAG: hypothetical protein KDC95_22305 [Planctomycetes bacterium]|nr:hypothetical protein [Planctomycetota bacterium]
MDWKPAARSDILLRMSDVSPFRIRGPSKRVVATLAVAALAASCQSYVHEDRDLSVKELPIDVLWSICLDTAQTEFRLDPAQMDIGKRTFVTRWRNQLRSMGQGRRRRVHFRIEKPEEGEGHVVRYWVELQRYGDIATPFEPKEDEWDDAGQDMDVERRLYRHLTIRVDQAKGVQVRKPRPVEMVDPVRGR